MERAIEALTIPHVTAAKGTTPLVGLTAYTTPMAKFADSHCDIILVGDSVGMVLHGYSSTIGVTLDMMILHGKAVRRGVERALMVVDMPFGSYETGPEQAFYNATRVISETGCTAVKLEGGTRSAETIRFLTERGIPVMAHIGLTPQSVNILGGYPVQGRGGSRDRILQDAVAVAQAGAFSVVLEKLPESLARQITTDIPIPTIGIGASVACDGQILVVDDILGMFANFKPRFAERFAELGTEASKAIAAYAEKVRERRFPTAQHVYNEIPIVTSDPI